MNQENQAKLDAEFFEDRAKNPALTREDFNKQYATRKTVKKLPDRFDVMTPHKKIYGAFKTYCAKFPNVETPNIFLSGGVGTGKTFAVNLVRGTLSDRGFFVEYTTAFNMVKAFQSYVQSFGRDSGQIDAFLDCDLLVIDDLGAEPIIRNVTLEHIYNVVNERLVNNRPFIITTNLTPEAVMARYDQRIASRILAKSTTACIEMTGKDLRLNPVS